MRPISLLLLFATTQLTALPTQPSSVTDNVHIEQNGSSLDVHAQQERSILNWRSFSIDTEEQVSFHLPHQDSAILNRVTGTETSEILGTLTSNGHVYLLNPHGVVIGKDALIDTASFLTSTLCVSDDAFLQKGQLLLEGTSTAKIVNLGTIRTQGGDVALLAHHVEQEGEISAQGELYVGAGHRFLLQPKTSPLLQICPDMPAKGVDLKGDIQALSIQIEADGAQQLGIRQSGRAVTLQEKEGRIVLSALKGPVEVAAELEASSIEAKGLSLNLTEDAHLSAHHISIAAQGGEFEQRGTLLAPEGSIELSAEGGICIYQMGALDVSGEKGGTISVHAPNMQLSGGLLADGLEGKIELTLEENFTATDGAVLSTEHEVGNAGSQTIIAESIFTSALHCAEGKKGGALHLAGERISLVNALFDVEGEEEGGEILLGQKGLTHTLYIDPSSSFHANSYKKGGKIHVWSDDKGDFLGYMSAYGASKEGTIEASSSAPLWEERDISPLAASQIQLIDPNAGNGHGFGTSVTVLPTGNIVVTKPYDHFGGKILSGAVYVYDGSTGALISAIRGAESDDYIGLDGITVLSNGNFAIRSLHYKNNLGSVTWGDGEFGISGLVSASNSIFGSSLNDRIGSGGITALTNGNFVISSPFWKGENGPQCGSVTWVDGTTGKMGTGSYGAVSALNSIVGPVYDNRVGSGGVTALKNGHFVISSPFWNNTGNPAQGAVTWGNGFTGQSATGFGEVSLKNSIVGYKWGDQVGSGGVIALANGNFVISSPHNSVGAANGGAVTWGDGGSGKTNAGKFEAVSKNNSIFGTHVDDQVSAGGLKGLGIAALPNGHFVISSPNWNSNRGAATWGNGDNGQDAKDEKIVSSSNSIVGSTPRIDLDHPGDRVGNGGVIALSNSHFVISSPDWYNDKDPSNLVFNAGAATWGDGTNGQSATGFGKVSVDNSIVGSHENDYVSSSGITALTNDHFVIASPGWNGTAPIAGAATWGNGNNGTTSNGKYEEVSTSNSIFGSQEDDSVATRITALINSHFVVSSPFWNGTIGAATWGNGNDGTTALGNHEAVFFTAGDPNSNSIVGVSSEDNVSSGGALALENGNYVILSPQWNSSTNLDVGAATWAHGNTTGGQQGQSLTGFDVVSSSNSLVGSLTKNFDFVSSGGAVATSNATADFYIISPKWSLAQGAVTWGDGTSGAAGAVSSSNSFIGTGPNAGLNAHVPYNPLNHSAVISFVNEERVIIGFLP